MTSPENKQRLSTWFETLQKRICAALEKLEHELTGESLCFTLTPWTRAEENGGGGTMGLLRGGKVFEKAGVNVSTVHGCFSEEFAKEIPGAAENPEFWASGISLVIHPLNPFVPAIHLNTRHICTSKTWFGGGADLTPTFEFTEDTKDFHKSFQLACDTYTPDAYDAYKKWCDDYFYLPHRQEPRGIGGIFYDYVNSGDFEKDFAFTRAVGEAFIEIYPELVRRHMFKPYSQDDKNKQRIKRGRYVEFNLLYDRGTSFGLRTGGNTDAILMSLPPDVAWP